MQSNQHLIPICAHLKPFRLAQDGENLLKIAKSMQQKGRSTRKHQGGK